MHDIKIIKLGCTGHIIRMEQERIPKKIPNGKFYNTRSVRKPRTRWEKVVCRNALQVLRIWGCRRRVGDRKEWRQWPTKMLWHHGWKGGLLKHFCDTTKTRKLKRIGGYINIQFRNQTYWVYDDEWLKKQRVCPLRLTVLYTNTEIANTHATLSDELNCVHLWERLSATRMVEVQFYFLTLEI